MNFFFLRSTSSNMVDVDNQKVDWRQLLEEEDSMPSSSQLMSPQSLSHSESQNQYVLCTAPDVSEHSSPDAVQIQEPSKSELQSKKWSRVKSLGTGMCRLYTS